MPESPDEGGKRFDVRIADEFVYGLAGIYSKRVLDQIENCVSLLETSPEIGSANVRQSLIDRFGKGIRKIPVSTFVIVYRFDGRVVDVLALVYGPGVS